MTTPTLDQLGLRPPDAAYRQAEAELTFARRMRAWAGAHRQSILILSVLLVAVGTVHGWGVAHAPSLNDDEGTYMSQAWAVQHEHRLEVYTYWYDHPPLGWMQIALYTFVTGSVTASTHAVVVGRMLMVGTGVVSAALLYILARRMGVRRGFAAAAVLLFGLSPLAVDYQRMVYLDNIAVPWLLGAMALAASPRRSLWAAAGSGACFAVAVLSKETFLLFAPALVLLLWVRSDPKTRAFCLTGLGATFGLLVTAYPLYALLKGELFPGPGHVSMWQGITFQLSSRQASGSVFSAASNAHHTVAGWLALDPWLLGLGLAALPVVLWTRRYRAVGVGLAVPVLVALRGGYLPGPFVIGLLPFAGLSVACALDAIVGPRSYMTYLRAGWRSAARPMAGTALAAVMVVALAGAWWPGDRTLTHQDATSPVFEAETWIETHVPPDQRMIVDNTIWTDLVDHGFNPHLGVVWFQKLDFTENLDPSVARALPGGWRDFAYIVSTPALLSSLSVSPNGFVPVRQAIAHSVVVASFGTGSAQVQVRKIQGADPQATLSPTRGNPSRGKETSQ